MINFRLVAEYMPLFLEALVETLKIAALSGLLALMLGTAIGMVSTVRHKTVQLLIGLYTGFIRSTPLLVQLYFIHYGVPILGFMPTSFQSALITFSLNSGAYISEIIRGGLNSIDDGQHKAAKSLGFTWLQTMHKIILPQVFKKVLPPLISQFSYLIKDTSLAAVLVIPELTYIARKIAARTYKPFEAFGMPMLMYFALYIVLSLLSRLVSTSQLKRRELST